MTVFELLTTSTVARIVPSYLRFIPQGDSGQVGHIRCLWRRHHTTTYNTRLFARSARLAQIVVATRQTGILGSIHLFPPIQVAAEQHTQNAGIHTAHHIAEEVERFNLVNQERIFLFVLGIGRSLLQVVEFAQVFLPFVVNDLKRDIFLEFTHQESAF